MTRTFVVSTDPIGSGDRYWLRVIVHDSAHQLQTAAAKWCDNDQGWDDVGGCFHQNHNPDISYIGLMRLCREHLTGSVIIHESVHAAAALARKGYDCNTLRLPRSVGSREELLAYATHEISTAILRHALDVDLTSTAA